MYRGVKRSIANNLLSTRFVQSYIRNSILQACPLTREMGNFCKDDVFIVGYPKSGNTWMQTLISALYFGVAPKLSRDTLIQELVPDVHYKAYYKRFAEIAFFKTHSLPNQEYKRVIYIIRDGRDVAVSAYHYLNALESDSWTLNKVITGAPFPEFGSWGEHVDAWLKNPFNAQMMVVKYEALVADCVKELGRIADFCRLELSRTELDQVAAQADFETMKAKAQRFGSENKRWPADKPFFRKGVVGDHQNYFTDRDNEDFVRLHGAQLASAGYV